MTSDSDEFLYQKLVAAICGLADRKGMRERVGVRVDKGTFEIYEVLTEALGLKGDFAGDHVDFVKKAFEVAGKPYPGDNIEACVRALLQGN